jgi:RNA polymerase sigma-70 factor, ECF subfamily
MTPIARLFELLRLAPGTGDVAALDAALSARLASAREAWPGVALSDEAFLPYLAERLGHWLDKPGGADVARALASIALEDVFLACACLHGDAAALADFDRALMPEVTLVHRRFSQLPIDAADARQRVLERLLLRDEPALARYGGQGPLRNWLRVLALRMLSNVHAREGREVPVDAALFDALGGASGEAAYLKQEYKDAFRDAFAAAVLQLSNRQRSLLRYAFSDGLNVDQIGAIYRVHRATAARWIAAAREKLVEETYAELLGRLQFTEGDLGSILRAALSQVNTTLVAYFRSPT